MTQHTTTFEIERPVSAGDAVAIAVPGPTATVRFRSKNSTFARCC